MTPCLAIDFQIGIINFVMEFRLENAENKTLVVFI